MRIPERLASTIAGHADREAWLAELPRTVQDLSRHWDLRIGQPFDPGGECSWVAPVLDSAGQELVLKVGRRHVEAEHEADGLRVWDGDGSVHLVDATSTAETVALLLERCRPGTSLKERPEPEQDEVVAGLLTRLWRDPPADMFRPLTQMCDEWADEAAQFYAGGPADSGLVASGLQLFRTLPRDATAAVLLCTDLHGDNILAAEREPWLVIDPKPYVGDPAYDVLQHMLNCHDRLAADPISLAHRLAALTDLEPDRVVQWLFARCVQEGAQMPERYAVAERLGASATGLR